MCDVLGEVFAKFISTLLNQPQIKSLLSDEHFSINGHEHAFFEHWRNPPELAVPIHPLEAYGNLKDRCVIVRRYFQGNLGNDFKAMMRSENHRIGFAFLDCNIASSYQFVFDFLLDVITPGRMIIKIDEYFEVHDPLVHRFYQDFSAKAKERYGLDC